MDDSGAMDEETANVQVNRVRKMELLKLEAEVQRLAMDLDTERAARAADPKRIAELEDQCANLRRQAAGEQKVSFELASERDKLQAEVGHLHTQLQHLRLHLRLGLPLFLQLRHVLR